MCLMSGGGVGSLLLKMMHPDMGARVGFPMGGFFLPEGTCWDMLFLNSLCWRDEILAWYNNVSKSLC